MALLTVFTGCSSDGKIIEQPEQQYYEIAQSRMKASNYFSAIEALEMIVTRYPFGRYAEQAQAELIYAYYENRLFDSAVIAAERFISLHPRHANTDYAYYSTQGRFCTSRGVDFPYSGAYLCTEDELKEQVNYIANLEKDNIDSRLLSHKDYYTEWRNIDG